MHTTVRLHEDDKRIIDRLQARYRLVTGQRISIENLISLILETAERHEDEVILEDKPRPLAAEQIKGFHSAAMDWGVETTEDEIDESLYGDEDNV